MLIAPPANILSGLELPFFLQAPGLSLSGRRWKAYGPFFTGGPRIYYFLGAPGIDLLSRIPQID